MSPRLSSENVIDGNTLDAEGFGECGLRLPKRGALSYRPYFLAGKPCLGVLLFSRTPPLPYHVSGVLGGSSEKQVSRVATPLVIAAMADEQAGGYLAVSQYPGESVHRLPLATGGQAHSTVGAVTIGPHPWPALIGTHNAHSRPELFGIGSRARPMALNESVRIAGADTARSVSALRPVRLSPAPALTETVAVGPIIENGATIEAMHRSSFPVGPAGLAGLRRHSFCCYNYSILISGVLAT